ncbi:MAG: 50S ribosomal protein L9 [Elusimicrobiaceae bacterium]|nr:50S ribosomal protein L9 [Elusimicrobiaceae bacterium]
MKVILRKDIETLGNAGEIKEVKLGYARNYLLPKGFVVEATPGNVKNWELGAARRKERIAKDVQDARAKAEKMGGTVLTFVREVGADEKLFGSVGKADILKSLVSAGHEIAKDAVILDAPIKTVGDTPVKLRLRKDVYATISVRVAPKAE